MKKNIKLFTTVMVCMAIALCVWCKKDDDKSDSGGGTQTVATVTTEEVTEITKTTAVCGGKVKSENGWAVTERGVCWGTEPNPTPSDSHTVDGEGMGAFTSEITGLAPGTKYYVRAYAKNAAGTGFGAEKSFTTLENGGGGGTQTVATVTTNNVTDITQTTATCGGEVKSENGWAVTERGVCWGTEPNPTPSDNCTVDGEGVGAFTSEITGLEPDTKYYVRAYAKNAAGTGFGEERNFTTQGTGGGGGGTGDHAYVDLGLPSGLLWATCNVGADKPEDYGNYYAWGETTTKSTYNWSTYKWCNGNWNNLTKYNTESDYGTVDNNTVLDPEDDAARANWGGDWRMPTYDELKELKDRCTWTWRTQGVKSGYRVTGPNGKSIFLPAAGHYCDGSLYLEGGYGNYLSSSLRTDHPSFAYGLVFDSGRVYMSDGGRYYGQSVRPVCPSQK